MFVKKKKIYLFWHCRASNSGWPRTHSVDQADLKSIRDLLASASQMLGILWGFPPCEVVVLRLSLPVYIATSIIHPMIYRYWANSGYVLLHWSPLPFLTWCHSTPMSAKAFLPKFARAPFTVHLRVCWLGMSHWNYTEPMCWSSNADHLETPFLICMAPLRSCVCHFLNKSPLLHL